MESLSYQKVSQRTLAVNGAGGEPTPYRIFFVEALNGSEET
ncbi:hypothetical protein [Candidatus Contendibacter odensensis]|uniref:Uncharacterized protein n=1 Tax=Candidatus Contendobacter odensis Run_B_J11 TaxID=1400861 RepID=A0A7U7G8L3_9GAMM|nr:hypothetical protein [Candidatus Contendobacter odensis]CDH43486.1 hypothetical protein BN874_1220003 [Candidatus Contendobacter odensis Run_B_J11]